MLARGVRLARAAAASAALYAVMLAAVWQPRLSALTQELAAQDAGDEDEEEGGGRSYQRIRASGPSVVAEYGFQNFNRDKLSVRFEVARKALSDYEATYGYSKADLDAIEAWHDSARQGAYQYAVKNNKGQKAVDGAMANLKAERDKKIREYMAERGFKVLPGHVVRVDMPAVVRRNAPLLKPLSLAFDDIASKRKYDSESLIGAVVSMVQTAMAYKIPPVMAGTKHTGGLLPPLKAVTSGWGDCDTKTGLAASILANWPHMRMVGLAVPGHYLMAVLRIPGKGEMFVEYQGLQYVLIEPAGPAWLPPGTVGRDTVTLLNASEGYAIEPFF